MKKFFSISFVLFLFGFCPAKAQTESQSISGQTGYISAELIYPLNSKPTPQCHASTIELTKDGLIAAWFGGTAEKNPDVGIWISNKIDGKWSEPVEVANGIQNDTLRYPCWNPVLFQPQDGPLILFYKVGPNPVEWWGMMMTSDDYGKTWNKSVRLPENILGPIKNKPVQLDSGEILCPSSTENNGWKVHLESTADLGKTWKVTEINNNPNNYSVIQPSILTYKNSLQILCRSKEGKIIQSASYDNGKTWGELTATVLPNPNSGIDAVTLKDGRQLLVYNNSTVTQGKWGGPRTPLNVAVSGDGIKWFPILILENTPGEYSYPAVIQTNDGLIHITYTFNRESIKHVVIDPAKLNPPE